MLWFRSGACWALQVPVLCYGFVQEHVGALEVPVLCYGFIQEHVGP